RMLDAVVAADKTCYIFSEGSTKRFWSYFKDLPKGHFAFHVEQDDIFEFKKELPNCCAVGGMHASLLGGGTKEQCVSYAKHLIDELGGEGFILSQDKMISYRNDTNPENLKAVCDFVREYR
ncbi:MAG: uroporphyrinogen decarboxylase family protein, partial [Clostridia bacterium]|nr:uroporphyrinogen decarboxylase family protein [Clostridia bacterium]